MKKALLLLFLALPLTAQNAAKPRGSVDCTKDLDGKAAVVNGMAQPQLNKIREISAGDTGVLSGTLYTVSEQVRMPAGPPGSNPVCYPQWVRAYRDEEPKNWNPPSSQLGMPMPGPTLRAKVGDVVNLTFLNSIDAAKFPNSDKGCDQTNIYPKLFERDPDDPDKTIQVGKDEYPDCFAHSVFTNVHFHGTHTSPNTTADNVFLTVRPSPRGHDPNNFNVPLILAKDVAKDFGAFFQDCNSELQSAVTTSKMWPIDWKKDLRSELQNRLMGYVEKYGLPGWLDKNNDLIEGGHWPQFYVGAYPYCFDLPKWVPPPATAAAAHAHGAGMDQAPPLRMGQAPGTHWYHAHKHGSTTINVSNGMTGVFVIEGDYDKTLKSYYSQRGTSLEEKVLVIQQLGSIPNLVANTRGDVNFVVNGQFKPVVAMKSKSVQMWRIANTAARAGAYFLPPLDLAWKQLAIDGVQLAPVNYDSRPDHFLIASGNRIDLLVKAPAYNDTGNVKDNLYDVLVYNVIDPGERPPVNPSATKLTLLTVQVTKDEQEMNFIPSGSLAPLPGFLGDVTDKEIAGTTPRVLRFATTPVNPDPRTPVGSVPAKHTIDGQLFNEDNPPVTVTLNRAEEWKVVNESYAGTAISHPFHIHINPFQLTEIFSPNSYIDVGRVRVRGGERPILATVSMTKGEPHVRGDRNSKFRDWFRVGDLIEVLEGGGQGGIIQKITNDREMILAGDATATVKDAIFTQLIPQYTVDRETIRQGQCYLDPSEKAAESWKPCTGKTDKLAEIVPGQCYGNPQVPKPCIEPEPAAQRVWWDVFPIPSGKVFTRADGTTVQIPGYFRMRSRFVDFPGYYVLHCHILAHEDRGMMTEVFVNPVSLSRSPYSHH